MTVVGVISDTHGLLRPEALRALAGCAHIIHGGDIGNAAILATLASHAPVTAVRGNNDRDAWAASIDEAERIQIEDISIHVLHDVTQLGFDPARRGIRVVVSGHSHQPRIGALNGVVYLNPGSAGPRRFRLPVTLARMTIAGDGIDVRVIDLVSMREFCTPWISTASTTSS